MSHTVFNEFFFAKLQIQIINQKSTFLLSCWMKILENTYQGRCVEDIITNTRGLGGKRLGEKVGFFSTGRQIIVYSINVKLCLPLLELYNAIYATMYENMKLKEPGYAEQLLTGLQISGQWRQIFINNFQQNKQSQV